MISAVTTVRAPPDLNARAVDPKAPSPAQSPVSAGQGMNAAADNAAYWSIATDARLAVNESSLAPDALGPGAGIDDGTYAERTNDSRELLDQIKSKPIASGNTGVPSRQVAAEITQLRNRLNDISKSTVINSETWLTQDSSDAGYDPISLKALEVKEQLSSQALSIANGNLQRIMHLLE